MGVTLTGSDSYSSTQINKTTFRDTYSSIVGHPPHAAFIATRAAIEGSFP